VLLPNKRQKSEAYGGEEEEEKEELEEYWYSLDPYVAPGNKRERKGEECAF
jgi:hypothetical protein